MAHLACHLNEEIYLVPITYVYEAGYIYSHSKLGKKIHLMRRNPKVCVQVEEVADFFHWKSVIAWGSYEELKHNEALAAMRWIIKTLASRDNQRKIPDLELDLGAIIESAIIYRIKVQRVTGCYEFKSGEAREQYGEGITL